MPGGDWRHSGTGWGQPVPENQLTKPPSIVMLAPLM